MLYTYIIILALICIVVIYILSHMTNVSHESNALGEMTKIYMNKDELERHAMHISTHYSEVEIGDCKRKLINTLDNNYEIILNGYSFIEKNLKDRQEIISSAEWLIDNFYLIEKEYKDTKSNMPQKYYRNLPTISKGSLKGYARIYQIAVEIIIHINGIVTEEIVDTFITAYQKNSTLTMGELWALPLMLKIALIQNISDVVKNIVKVQKDKNLASKIGENLINSSIDNKINEEIDKLNSMNIELSSHFICELIKICRDNGINNENVVKWLDEKIQLNETTIDGLMNSEYLRQSEYQLQIGNSINSIRNIQALRWKLLFEKLSAVENVLSKDPSGIYSKMDFSTRDYYRHKVEEISKKFKISEIFIANKAIECAEEGSITKDEQYVKHVGYYIADNGVNILLDKLNVSNKFSRNIKQQHKMKIGTYILALVISIGIIEGLFFTFGYRGNFTNIVEIIVLYIALLIPCSEIVITVMNFILSKLYKPSFIPKMNFEDGIGCENKTIVVIPAIIESSNRVKSLMQDLETYFLGNNDKNIFFALLADLEDSKSEVSDKDSEIIEAGVRLCSNLNAKYGFENKFLFLCRKRMFNKKEDCYMGLERKRGKLCEFNHLLRGDKNTTYNIISTDIESLGYIKYVVTLDADTVMPRENVSKLVGAMAHVLNEAKINSKSRVFRGYGIMQPRVNVGILSSNKTPFSKIFSGESGLDQYTTAVSDVYQDAFGEGIFTGKGIYNVDVFNTVLKGEIKENKVLSHDLLEGSYLRTALLTDVEVVDGYPAYYMSSAKRLHRWVRGDWQLIPWLRSNKLNGLSKYKIFDNLRRSLLIPSIIISLAIGLSITNVNFLYFLLIGLSITFPIVFDFTECVIAPIKGLSLSGKLKDTTMAIEQIFLMLVFMPFQTYNMIDAVVRTLYRMLISKKKFLQWQTAAQVESNVGKKLISYVKYMWAAPVISIIIAMLSISRGQGVYFAFLFPCVLWFISPYIAYLISKDIKAKEYAFNNDEVETLRNLSRKTWSYFDDFVNESNNYLAPDNYQEDPLKGVATRTSPTNIGMGLTSNICAVDLGYISINRCLNNLKLIMDNVESLEKFHGHLYNWYDTVSKKPLYPRYVSTVDSGNLVAYMWVCASSIKNVFSRKNSLKNMVHGLNDTIRLSGLSNEKLKGVKVEYTNREDLIEVFDKIQSLLEVLNTDEENNLDYWNIKLKEQCKDFINMINYFAPWIKFNSEDRSAFSEILYIYCENSIYDIVPKLEELLNNKFVNDSKFVHLINESIYNITNIINSSEELIVRLNKFVDDTDFTVLYNFDRKLFSIGYDIESDTLNNSYYDLLASEARCASFVAIAKGDVEKEHWFNLGRSMSIMGRGKGLTSWSGTMFEYFMPLLIMKNYKETLLDCTYENVIAAQKKYCRSKGIPWGISESAYYYFDLALNYQYRAFGVPGVGLKNGLINDLVIAPYATVITLQKDKRGAINNINRLIENGFEGRYGFYEAIDYTKDRIGSTKEYEIVKCFMVHHEGMSLMALNNVLNNNILQERFHDIPRVKSTELLLQEKVPKNITYNREESYEYKRNDVEKFSSIVRTYKTANTSIPQIQLLSNGSYDLMISGSGSGYSKKDRMGIYRWRQDVTLDNLGLFFYIKNVTEDNYWSATYEPCKTEGDDYTVSFSLDKAMFKRKDNDIYTQTEVIVSSEEDAEIRVLTITNNSEKDIEIEVTSYCEITMAPYDADIVHPAFSNLFVQTEYINENNCIIANRRPRAKHQTKNYVMNIMNIVGEGVGKTQYETSRANFIGRNRTLKNPVCMDSNSNLQNSSGFVVDPVIALRQRIKIRKGDLSKVIFISATSTNKEDLITICKKYSDLANVNRAFEVALTKSMLEMRYMGLKSKAINLYQMLASNIIFLNSQLKERAEYIKNIKLHQSDLWPYGISGDMPIVTVTLSKEEEVEVLKSVIKAHEYLSIKGLKFDLVILNYEPLSYNSPVSGSIMQSINSTHLKDKVSKSGGVFVLNTSSISKDFSDFILAISRFVIYGEKGVLASQIVDDKISSSLKFIKKDLSTEDKSSINYIREMSRENELVDSIVKIEAAEEDKEYRKRAFLRKINFEMADEITPNDNTYNLNEEDLLFFNGYGGFKKETNEYVVILNNNSSTPAPWINVLSNENFGTHISESGSSYTWCSNSRENKITPWSNDPVTDSPGEILYIKDNDSDEVFTITASPIRDKEKYIIEHGFGYSKFSHTALGIHGEETIFVPRELPCKVIIVKLKNTTNNIRNLSLYYYAQLVLGVYPGSNSPYITTTINKEKGYIYAQNPYSGSFSNLKAFLSVTSNNVKFTGDRGMFLGRGGDISLPKAIDENIFEEVCGSGYDPCLASLSELTLNPYEEVELSIVLGQCNTFDEIEHIIEKYNSVEESNKHLQEVKDYWAELLGRVKVKTPDESMNILLNGWLMYQTIVCRYWARTAFYQSGGAYGYRDQLQDSMAIGFIDSSFTRDQILRSATRQYLEGDVQHWWHPVVDSGIRTRFSDDLLWLPYVVCDYIKNTGDYSILDEEMSYLEDTPLQDGEDERYNVSRVSETKGTIYEHCIKAIERGLTFGSHNIPLMGSGDWNDGMSTVGNEGKGESVWVGWFLYSILKDFILLCEYKKDKLQYEYYTEKMEFIKLNLDENAWDGNWYRRAYFDDGTPLGSSQNDECKIDSIAQSWSVISTAGNSDRAKIAMESLEKHLVKEDSGMILLLTPAFDNSMLEPGYIKGYVPGVRENGTQYTHAAVWVIVANARLKNGDRASKLFNMINPINHSNTRIQCERYKVEPYVMAADVYNKEPYIGRGGWTWYTGASGWMFRAGVEEILGLKLKGTKGFTIEPVIASNWNGYEMYYRKFDGEYEIVVRRGTENAIFLDNKKLEDNLIPYVKGKHKVEVIIK